VGLKDEILRKHVEPSPEFTAATNLAERLLENLELVVRGKRGEIKLVLCALLCRGHVLLEDVPGTAKTVLARAISQSIEGSRASRIQCTPDLQPTDLTGLSVYNQKEREFEFRPGPVFANIVLVDEINRAMPRTHRPCSRPWPSGRSPPTGSRGRCRTRSSSSRPRTRSTTKGPFPFPRRSSIGSSSRRPSAIRAWTTRCASSRPSGTPTRSGRSGP
jgi:ATPase family associated with various cellular activities (AAA)